MLKLFLQGNSQRTIWSPMEEKERKWHQNKTGEKSDFPFPAVLLMRKLNHILTKQIREMRQLQHLCEHQKNVTHAKDRNLNSRDSKGNIPENASQKLAAKEYLTTTHSQQLEKPPISNAGKRDQKTSPCSSQLFTGAGAATRTWPAVGRPALWKDFFVIFKPGKQWAY